LSAFELRCQGPGSHGGRCENFLGKSEIPLQLAHLFKASAPNPPTTERGIRCRRCGHVNVFRPLTLELELLIV
jgi:hypothetical protein